MNGCVLYLPFYAYGANAQKIWDMSGQGNHGVITGAVPGTYPMLQPVASGSVTKANMGISAVNGTSFVDFSAADVLTGKLDHFLVVKDSAGRTIQGYIKAVGTGETLGDGLVTGNNSTFTAASDWANNGLLGYDETTGGVLTLTGSAAWQECRLPTANAPTVLGGLYKTQIDVVTITGSWRVTNYAGTFITIPTMTSAQDGTTVTAYFVGSDAGGLNIHCPTPGTGIFDNVKLYQVLTPSATGVTVSSTKGGTENWESKEVNFNYNDASGYTYAIYQVLGQRGSGWFADQVDDRIVHSSLNLGTTHTLHYWLLYRGFAGVIHGGAANYHGLRLTPTACGYNIGNTEVTVTHSASYGEPVLFSINRNGTAVDFYKNGVKIGSTQTLGANTAQVLTDFFRYSNGTSYWGGTIFDVLAFNSNMGAQAIRIYFELTRSRYGV